AVAPMSPLPVPSARLDAMKDDRSQDGRDVTESGGYIRPKQVNDRHFGTAPLGGAAEGARAPDGAGPADGGNAGEGARAPDGAGPADGGNAGDGARAVGGGPTADRRMGAGLPRDPGLTTENGKPGAANTTGGPGGPGTVDAPGAEPPTTPGPRHEARARKPKHRGGRSWWIEVPVLLVFALVLALVIKTFVVQAFYIPSSSMENTLDIGDKVLVNKL